MCMADKFSRDNMGDGIAVAHCNFRLRGCESDSDEELVRHWAESHGIQCFVTGFDTEDYAKEHGISIEMAARDLRYAWFAEIARENGFDAVAVAHNADDNAETLLLNLLRGTGVRGASGIRERGVLPGASDILLLRPLLGMSRKDIDLYNNRYSVPFRIDSTNLETNYKRNKIRHKVMPVFSEINPSYLQTLSRDMEAFSEVSDIADEYFELKKQALLLPCRDGESVRISLSALCGSHHTKYLLFRLLEEYGFSYGDLDSICRLLESAKTVSGKQFFSSGFRLVSTSSELIVLSREKENMDNSQMLPASLTIESEGEYELLGQKFSVSVEPWSKGMALKQPSGVLIADARVMTFPFTVRRWAPGDWMKPLGLKGKKKISDILTDLKVDILKKESVLVAVLPSQQKSAALLGLRIDESFKVSDDTESIVRITLL